MNASRHHPRPRSTAGGAGDDPRSWVEAELGGDVYGLRSIFREAQKRRLPVPKTTAELPALLYEHLYVQGGSDFIRLDEHSLRVRTDDDEVEPRTAPTVM